MSELCLLYSWICWQLHPMPSWKNRWGADFYMFWGKTVIQCDNSVSSNYERLCLFSGACTKPLLKNTGVIMLIHFVCPFPAVWNADWDESFLYPNPLPPTSVSEYKWLVNFQFVCVLSLCLFPSLASSLLPWDCWLELLKREATVFQLQFISNACTHHKKTAMFSVTQTLL